MSFCVLWVLATMDGGFAGFRNAAGRNALIEKRTLYRMAILHGMRAAQLPAALTGVAVIAIVLTASDRAAEVVAIGAAARKLTCVYGAYATLVLVALAVYMIAWVELRVLTTVILLGPFTLLRPFVIAGGVIAVARISPVEVVACAAIAGISMIALGPCLGRRSGHNKQS
ncbi:MAG: hypothetical protein JWO36_6176 [Myxococcales bacterium]|nr:hypothetical protein [Myxococcales bacterium]